MSMEMPNQEDTSHDPATPQDETEQHSLHHSQVLSNCYHIFTKYSIKPRDCALTI